MQKLNSWANEQNADIYALNEIQIQLFLDEVVLPHSDLEIIRWLKVLWDFAHFNEQNKVLEVIRESRNRLVWS